MDNWKPRLNSRGRIATGAGEIRVDGELLTKPGWGPQWRRDDNLVFIGDGDKLYSMSFNDITPILLLNIPVSFFAAAADKFAIPSPLPNNDRQIGLSIDNFTGQLSELVEHNNDNFNRSVKLNGQVIVEHAPYIDIFSQDGLLVFSQFTGITKYDRTTLGLQSGQLKDLRVFKSGPEMFPVCFMTPEGPWVLIMTNNDLRLHPWNSVMGFIINTGEDNNFYPNARFINNEINVVWNDKYGNLGRESFSLADKRVDTSAGNIPKEPEKPKVPEVKQPPNKIETVKRMLRLHPEIEIWDDAKRAEIVELTINAEGGKPWGRKARNEDGSNKNTDGLTWLIPNDNDEKFFIIDILAGVEWNPKKPDGGINPDRTVYATWDVHGPFKPGENGWWAPGGSIEDKIPVPPKEDPKMPNRTKDQIRDGANEIIRFYNDPDGLNRRNRGIESPIVIHDQAVWDWIALFLSGTTVDEVKNQIRTFPEYKDQHK